MKADRDVARKLESERRMHAEAFAALAAAHDQALVRCADLEAENRRLQSELDAERQGLVASPPMIGR